MNRQGTRREKNTTDLTELIPTFYPSSTKSWFAGSLVVSLIAFFSLVDVSGLNLMLNVFVKQLAVKECFSLNSIGETTL